MLLRAARASIPIAVAIAVSGCGGGAGGPAPPIDKATYVPPQQELMAAGPLGDRVLGKATAPVTVIEYVSLTCPHCANFHKTLFPRMKKEFIDTGKVRYIVREFPIGHTVGNGGHRQSLRAGRQIFLPAEPVPHPAAGMGQPGGPPRRHLCGRQIERHDARDV